MLAPPYTLFLRQVPHPAHPNPGPVRTWGFKKGRLQVTKPPWHESSENLHDFLRSSVSFWMGGAFRHRSMHLLIHCLIAEQHTFPSLQSYLLICANLALAGVAQWVESRLWTKGSLVWLLVRAHAWVVGQVPGGGYVRGNHTLMFLSHSYSFPSLLSKNKWIKSFFKSANLLGNFCGQLIVQNHFIFSKFSLLLAA